MCACVRVRVRVCVYYCAILCTRLLVQYAETLTWCVLCHLNHDVHVQANFCSVCEPDAYKERVRMFVRLEKEHSFTQNVGSFQP